MQKEVCGDHAPSFLFFTKPVKQAFFVIFDFNLW